jgi:hypothetical protein
LAFVSVFVSFLASSFEVLPELPPLFEEELDDPEGDEGFESVITASLEHANSPFTTPF